MMIPPLLNTLANVALEEKLRIIVKLDPFWREQLATLNGLHLYIELQDMGFKRVVQFGPTDLHLLAPFTQSQVRLITRSHYSTQLKDQDQTQKAIDEGHIQLSGDEQAIKALQHYTQSHYADWEAQLAQIMPDALAYQLTSFAKLAFKQVQHASESLSESYHFWQQNERKEQHS